LSRWFTERDSEIWKLALPAFGALVAEPLYLLADTAVVGNIGDDGVNELGGLALASQVLLLTLALFIFLAYGTTGAVARLIGAGEERKAAHQAVQSLWLAAGVGVILGAAVALAARPLLRLLGGDQIPEVIEFAVTYLRISAFGLPAMLIMLAGVGYLRGLQDTVRPLVVAVITAIGNFVLEAILIWGFGYSVGASALSTVLFQWLGAGLYLWWIVQAVSTHKVGLAPDPAVLTRLAVAGVDLFFRTLALRGSFTVAVAVASRMGKVELAAHEVAFGIWSLTAYALDAVAIAGQAMIGKFLGAHEPHEARAVGWRITQWGVVLGVVSGVIMLALRSPLASIFSNNAEVVELTAFLLLLGAVSQPINGIAFALDGVLIGAGDLRYLARAMLGSALVFVPLCVLILVLDAGIGWLWAALILFMATRAVALVARFRTTAWQQLGGELN